MRFQCGAMADNDVLIDWEQMDMIADGYTPDFVEILREFASEIPSLLEQLERLAHESEYEAAARIAHQVKGSSANFGFRQVSESAAAIESRAKSGSLDGVDALLARARAGFDGAMEALRMQRGLST